METIVSIKPLLAVLTSSISAIFILSARKNPNLRESWSIIAGVLKLFIVLSMIPAVVYNNTIIEYSLFTPFIQSDICVVQMNIHRLDIIPVLQSHYL